jgi:hypothetical protein
MHEIRQRLERVKALIRETSLESGRGPESVKLVAVSKTMPADLVREAVEAGADILGENYVQEAREKISTLSDLGVAWHFIGHLQSNKAKYAVRLFDLIHTVDSLKLAQELDRQCKKDGILQEILIQVNIAEDDRKAGISPGNAKELIADISRLEHLRIKGLMTMPPFFYEPEKARPFFRRLRQLRDRLQLELASKLGDRNALDELSMGMTGDFQVAIEEGATLVRIGTAIFGERQ